MKSKVIPVIIGVTGTISKSFRQYLYKIPGKQEINKAKKKKKNPPYWALHTYIGKY